MKKQVLTCLTMLIATMAMAQKPIEMNLWPDGPKTIHLLRILCRGDLADPQQSCALRGL